MSSISPSALSRRLGASALDTDELCSGVALDVNGGSIDDDDGVGITMIMIAG